MSPYRRPEVPEPAAAATAARCPDRELIPVFLLLWAISAARVACGLFEHETFGTAGTLAFLAVFFIPCLMKDAILCCYRSRTCANSASFRSPR